MMYEGLPIEEHYFYSHLDELAKTCYRKMLTSFLNFDLTYTYRGEEEEHAYYRAFDAIREDYPETFPIQGDLMIGLTEENSEDFLREHEDGSITRSYGSYYTREEYFELLGELDAIYHSFDGITDPFELELAVYHYTLEHFSYEHDYKVLTGQAKDEMHTVVGFLREGRGVCQAYTRFMQYILQRRGIPVVPYTDLEGDHIWLVVKIDGEYYHVEATWDDGHEDDPDHFPYAHFNITDDEIDIDHDRAPERYPDVVCRATAANYYRRRGLFFESDEAAIEGARRFARENEPTSREVQFFCFRMPPMYESEALSEGLAEALRGHSTAKWVELEKNGELGWYRITFGYAK